jgi:DNA-directed RNA polymerase beta subunit
LGVARDPLELYADMKNKKHRGIISIYTSIVFHYKAMEIAICSDGGRLTRPLLRVGTDGQLLLKNEHLLKLQENELGWNDFFMQGVLPEAVMEYIDPDEQNQAMVAMKSKRGIIGGGGVDDEAEVAKTGKQRIRYTHAEIHPSTILGILASCIPFPEHNQAPRNTYQTAMGKQAMGIYATNYDKRMDKTGYILTYPSRPLVDTRLMNFIELNRIPSGCQIHVAIMTHTGYNQEDSVLINQGAIDRGLFMTTIFHTEKDEDKNLVRDEIIRCKPDPAKTRGMKFGNYEKLDSKGFIPKNKLIENRDVIIAKITPIKENRNDPTKVIKYEDQSKVFRTTEDTYVDKNITGRNGEGYNFAKVRTRTLRPPVIGDKFACAKPTQQVLTDKGWVAFVDLDATVHKVATLDKAGCLTYELPARKFEYDYDDVLYCLRDEYAEIVCTPNHKLYCRTLENLPFSQLDASRTVGAFVQFQRMMPNCYPYYDLAGLNDTVLTIRTTERMPEYVWRLSCMQCRSLLKLMPLSTSNREFADEIVRLSVHCGYTATVKTDIVDELDDDVATDAAIITATKKYMVSIEREEKQLRPWKNGDVGESWEYYRGKVYCVEMPSSNLYYFRENENAPPMLSGNSRSAQKGTLGNIIPECDMPYTRSGLRPDLILNPHAIPSRMTIAQLKETLLGKVLVELGMFGDGTAFNDCSIEFIRQELSRLGYESCGNEIMYNGCNGRQMETSIFIGPVFYQRLKHMVLDKQHSRAIGPMVNLTRQPAEGRCRDGGFRIGEMERDVMIAHGTAQFCRERLYDVSDKYAMWVCGMCGMAAGYNDGDLKAPDCLEGMKVHHCRTCDNRTDFVKVDVPYTYKLLTQELQTINVVPRFVTEHV